MYQALEHGKMTQRNNVTQQKSPCVYSRAVDQILQMLNKNVRSLAGAQNHPKFTTGNATSVGIFSACLNIKDLLEWIIDIGAKNHMVSSPKLLNESTIVEKKVPHKVCLPYETHLLSHTLVQAVYHTEEL